MWLVRYFHDTKVAKWWQDAAPYAPMYFKMTGVSTENHTQREALQILKPISDEPLYLRMFSNIALCSAAPISMPKQA